MSFLSEALWVLLLGSLLGLELIGKVPPTLHTPLMSGANAISGITVLAALTLIIKAVSHAHVAFHASRVPGPGISLLRNVPSLCGTHALY